MNNDKLITALEQIRTLAEQALKGRARSTSRKIEKRDKPRKRSSSTKLPDHIVLLRDDGFFKQPRTAKEVHAKLQSQYHCDLNRVEVALLRLQKRGKLRKTSKVAEGKRQVAYVW